MNNKDSYCPIDCPNRTTRLGKGYCFLFSITLTALVVWQSVDIKFNRNEGLELKTRDVPLTILIPSFLFIAAALGINTDSIAQKLGSFLSKD